ncbi:unnamed protein product [Rotaria magnacalcarata]
MLPMTVTFAKLTLRLIYIYIYKYSRKIPPQRRNREVSNSENDDKKIISCIENLSNEIFYEIFDFLDGCEIYQAFSNLNDRFQTLITCSTLRLKIDLSTRPDSSLEYGSKYVVVPNKDRIIALSWPFSYDHNLGYTLFNIDSSFIRLEILTLRSIRANDLIPLLINMISLPHLFSLTINYDEDPQEISNIYQASFNLSMLKYFKLSFFAFETLLSISINVDKQLTTIKYLVIDHCCSLDELIALLSCTHQLCQLTCEQVNESHKNIVKDTLYPILSLTRISIGRCYANFNEIEIFLTKIPSQLEVLRFNSFSDVNYLDANRWERIISQYLQHLNIFEFHSDRDQSAFDEYYGEMPWLALDFSERDKKKELSNKFNVDGIPTLILLNGDS